MRNRSDRFIAFMMLLPSLILLGIFVYGFIFQTIQTSMTDWGENRAQPALAEDVVKTDVGLENYERLMTAILEFNFRNSLVNTFFFTILFVAGSLLLGFLLAMLLDQRIAGEAFFRTTFLFPMALSFVVTGTIWRWMLQPDGGVNVLPTMIGLDPIDFNWISSREVWLGFEWNEVPRYLTYIGVGILAFIALNYVANQRWTATGYAAGAAAILIGIYLFGLWDEVWLPLDNPETEESIAPKGFNAALLGIILAAIWQMSGYTMAMFLAGIRGIPDELRSAAMVDGCTEIGVYRFIILPQLRPVALSAVIILGHISLKIFDLVFAMAGPDNAQTVVPGVLVYTMGFRANRFASASAIAFIMLILVATVIIPYLWSQLRQQRA
ncbi:MAG: carbohydrate ABC transporter permease [Anaerolineales bacterium]